MFKSLLSSSSSFKSTSELMVFASSSSIEKTTVKGSPSTVPDKSDVVIQCMEVDSFALDSTFHKSTTSLYPETSISQDEFTNLADQTPALPMRTAKLFTLFRYANPHDIALLGIAYVSAILSGAALPLANFIIGRVTQDFSNLITKDLSPEDFRPSVDQYALYFVYLGIGIGGLSFISTYILADRGEVLAGRIRQHYFAAIIRQNTAYFEQVGHSEVTKRIIDDTQLIQEAISENSGICLSGLALFISSLVVGFISSWKITCLMLSSLTSIIICALTGFSFLRKWQVGVSPMQQKTASLVSQIIQSIHTSAALGASHKHAMRLNIRWKQIMSRGFWRSYINALVIACCWFIVYSTYALGFWQGSREVENETIDIGSLITTITAIVIGGFTVSSLWPTINTMRKGVEAGKRIFETIDRESSVDPTSEDGLELSDIAGKIEFRNVKLRFPSNPNQVVIKDFSLTINPGETVAILGPPGSGKSTLLGLLERYYDPVKGNIYIDDIDITKLNIHFLRRQIAYVAQEPFLFSGTIYENIAQGFDNTPYAEQTASVKLQMITKACHNAHAWGFILSMKNGLESQVGERGCLLTMSQRQRIAIARAIVSHPKIFLLDDITSFLSPRSEQFVQDALREIYKKRTAIIVTHKLPVLRHADRIIIMNEGAIVEQGTHLELMSKSAWYCNFVGTQKERKVGDKTPLVMFNKDRKASEISVRSARGGPGNMAFEILDWNTPSENNGGDHGIPMIKKAPTKVASISSSSLIGMVSFL